MSRGNPRQFTTVGAPSTVTSGAEVVVGSFLPVWTDGKTQIVTGAAFVNYVSDNEGNPVTFRVRRGSLTGTLVETVAIDPPVGSSSGDSAFAGTVMFEDQPGEVAGLVYVLTLQDDTGPTVGAMAAPVLSAVVQ